MKQKNICVRTERTFRFDCPEEFRLSLIRVQVHLKCIMETCMIAVEENQNDIVKMYSCFDRTCSSITVDDVYEIAKAVGAEVEKLIDGYGKSSVEGLVSHIVKVLELLESFAARNQAHKCKEDELLKAFETLQLQQQKKRHVKECDETSNSNVTESGVRTWSTCQQCYCSKTSFLNCVADVLNKCVLMSWTGLLCGQSCTPT